MKNQNSILSGCHATSTVSVTTPTPKLHFNPGRGRRRWRRGAYAALLIPRLPSHRVQALDAWIDEVPRGCGESVERQGLSEGTPTGMSAIRQTRMSALRGFALCIGVVAIAAALCGCQSIAYTSPTGEKFNRVSVGSKLAIGSLSVTPGTNGTRGIELRGYENDSAQAIGTLTEAAVRGALNGITPRPVSP